MTIQSGQAVARDVALLTAPDNRTAYAALRRLEEASERSDEVYGYLDRFSELLDDENSYARSRGLALIGKNARWDAAGRIDALLDRFLDHVEDPKPITARQCLRALAELAPCKPALAPRIRARLEAADCARYPDSMAPLVQRDICALLRRLDRLAETPNLEK